MDNGTKMAAALGLICPLSALRVRLDVAVAILPL